jgi:hypothetical protein
MPDIEWMAVIGYLKAMAHLTPSESDVPACRDPHASVGTFKESARTPCDMQTGASFGVTFTK